jgi:hypothetical protein
METLRRFSLLPLSSLPSASITGYSLHSLPFLLALIPVYQALSLSIFPPELQRQ